MVDTTATYPTKALMFSVAGGPDSNDGVRCGLFGTGQVLNSSTLTGLTGLFEQEDTEPNGETINAGQLFSIFDKYPTFPPILGVALGYSAQAWGPSIYGAGIAKGTQTYTNVQTAVRSANGYASSLYSLPLIVWFEDIALGFTDSCASCFSDETPTTPAAYEAATVSEQQNRTADNAAYLGPSGQVPLFQSQMNDSTLVSAAQGEIAMAQLKTCWDNPSTIYCDTPTYWVPRSATQPHWSNYGQECVGEKKAETKEAVLINGAGWLPFAPTNPNSTSSYSTTTSPPTLTIYFAVPVPPLVWNNSAVTPQNVSGTGCNISSTPFCEGFELYDSGGALINSVSLGTCSSSTCAVTLGLSKVLSGSGSVGYAYTGVSGANAGPMVAGSQHGNLADSDPLKSRLDGTTPLPNWAWAFLLSY